MNDDGVNSVGGRGSNSQSTQFKKGNSGNPRGRPRGAKNLSTLLRQAANTPITATINGEKRTISTLAATAMQLGIKAAGGDMASMAKFLDWIDKIETRESASKPDEYPVSESDLEVLRAVYDRMLKCAPPEED